MCKRFRCHKSFTLWQQAGHKPLATRLFFEFYPGPREKILEVKDMLNAEKSNVHPIRPDVREELAKMGCHHLSEIQLLALVLRAGNARQGVMRLAQELQGGVWPGVAGSIALRGDAGRVRIGAGQGCQPGGRFRARTAGSAARRAGADDFYAGSLLVSGPGGRQKGEFSSSLPRRAAPGHQARNDLDWHSDANPCASSRSVSAGHRLFGRLYDRWA